MPVRVVRVTPGKKNEMVQNFVIGRLIGYTVMAAVLVRDETSVALDPPS